MNGNATFLSTTADLPRGGIWPVWSQSTRKPVDFAPMSKKTATRLFHDARRFERQTRRRGHQDGALGRNAIAVLHALIFDHLNFASGRLDPGYKTIARSANVSVRSVSRGLARLKAAGVLTWLRRCEENIKAGAFRLIQTTNAYAILPSGNWSGFFKMPDPPTPHRETWGAAPAVPTSVAAAATETSAGQHQAAIAALESDPGDGLAAAIARLARLRAPGA